MRSFLAIFPPKSLLRSFIEVQKKLYQYKRFLRFTKPSNIHITIKYLGNDTKESDIEKLMIELKRNLICFRQFNVRMNKLRFGFRSEKWPRIIFASIFKNDQLDKLTNIVNNTMNDFKLKTIHIYKVDNPIYHFTLCRKRKDLSRNLINKMSSTLEEICIDDGFIIEKVDLVSSKLKKKGPIYSKIDYIKLK